MNSTSETDLRLAYALYHALRESGKGMLMVHGEPSSEWGSETILSGPADLMIAAKAFVRIARESGIDLDGCHEAKENCQPLRSERAN